MSETTHRDAAVKEAAKKIADAVTGVAGFIGHQLQDAYERRQASIYAEIRTLPSPWKADMFDQRMHCEWCGAVVDMPVSHDTDDTVHFAVVPHPDSTCLWPRAHAVSRPAGEGV